MLEYSSISLKEKTKKTHRFPELKAEKEKKKSIYTVNQKIALRK